MASSSIKKLGTPTSFRLSSFLRHVVSTPKTDTETDTAHLKGKHYILYVIIYQTPDGTVYNPSGVLLYCLILH